MELDKTQRTNDVLKIWQQNLNKSSACQHDLISSGHLYNEKIDIVVLQDVRTLAWSLQIYILFETDNFRYHSLALSHVPLRHMTPPDPL